MSFTHLNILAAYVSSSMACEEFLGRGSTIMAAVVVVVVVPAAAVVVAVVAIVVAI